ncbi:uncharacterized protein LOC123556747 isoform X1 [Mercenaria mercenaria]|uniref:uncharacterized protein LOC123556747 isoform X1 n=2 Tax=Mercenaria mercenaria TaxID=6596 RepID=UPI00234F06DF|nr:uncharacterized protein LOC123556747 isoform X1 [Mercenaria mercenaria]
MVASIAQKVVGRIISSKKSFLLQRPELYAVISKRSNSYGNVLKGDTVRIGCASGFWGDSMVAAPQLIHMGKLDYLVFDYLSEITMSLLAAVKKKTNGAGGFTPDFVQVAMAPHIKDIKSKGVKVISNAGGVNPEACAAALKTVCEAANVDLSIAVVTGDDLMSQIPELQSSGITEMNSGISMPTSITSMNAYLGAGPISRALDLGADIVVTGRCVDSALVLAPLLHKFQWSMEDFDALAKASLAGHLVECGAQVTGGIFTDWHTIKDWSNIGFPIVECASDGDFVVTKPPKTGGLVSKATVAEQLLYELGDPSRYQLPDVVCDFTDVRLEEVQGQEGEAVFVSGAKGLQPSPNYKVSATYAEGFRLTAVCGVGGPRSKDKALKTAEEILKRCRRIFKQLKLDDFTKVHTEILGSEHNYGPMTNLPQGSRESVLWLAVHHKDKKALEILAREIAPAGTGMAPGLTGIVGGRPKVSPVLKLFSFLHDKQNYKIDIKMNGEHVETFNPTSVPTTTHADTWSPSSGDTGSALPRGTNTYRLEDLAYTRSGDKGNNCNIGVVARHPSLVPYLKEALTEAAVADYFGHMFDNPDQKRVRRYDVPGINGFNFVLLNCLGGGGIASLRSDPQGKAYGQILLDFQVKDMPNLTDITS